MSEPVSILSPCIGLCTLDAQGLCLGCLRSGDEIAAWLALDDAERRYIMDVVVPERAAQRALP